MRELADWYIADDGSYVFNGRLTPEQGERLLNAVAAAIDEEFAERKNVSAETPDRPAIESESDRVAQRRGDALVHVADGFLGGKAGTNGGERHTIHVHTDLDTLRADGEGAEGWLESGAHVSAETSFIFGAGITNPAWTLPRKRQSCCGKAKKWTAIWRLTHCYRSKPTPGAVKTYEPNDFGGNQFCPNVRVFVGRVFDGCPRHCFHTRPHGIRPFQRLPD